ncbi:MAG: hypothetical protein AAF616_15190 [Bacteroidota bacterium]
MKHSAFTLSLVVLLFCGCKEDEPTLDDSLAQTKVVGDLIYYLSQGSSQSGTYGAMLDPITIVIKDLNGNRVYRNLSYEISDKSGSVQTQSYSSQDTVSIAWRLGCNDRTQVLTVTDENVCGLRKNECIAVEIFQIEAMANRNNATGWVAPCLPFSTGNYTSFQSSNDRMYFLEEDMFHFTKDPYGYEWETVETGLGMRYSRKWLDSKGNFYTQEGDELGIYFAANNAWRRVSNPFGSYSNTRAEMTDNGFLFLANEYSGELYRMNNGSNWELFFTFADAFGNTNYLNPQALATDGNDVYILARGNSVLKINGINGTYTTFELNSGWNFYDDLGDIPIYVKGSKILIRQNNSVKEINLNTLSMSTLVTYNYNSFQVSDDKLFLVGQDELMSWDGQSLITESILRPPNTGYSYYSIAGVYNGYPMYFDNTGRVMIYATN